MAKDIVCQTWQGEIENGKFVPVKATRCIKADIIKSVVENLKGKQDVQSL